MILGTSRNSVFGLLKWQWKNVLIFSVFGAIPLLLHYFVPDIAKRIVIPATPLTVVGAALGIFVSFRTNSSYDRWWEGRKLWGRMINTSRHLATQVTAYIDQPEVATRMLRRHCAYVHALRAGLRNQDPFSDEHFLRISQDAVDGLKEESNLCHALLNAQTLDVVALDKAGHLSEFRTQLLDKSVEKLLDIQGGCERIKKTPLPRGYGFIAEQLILVFALFFPFLVFPQLHWATIPCNILVCLAFALISEAGRVLEDPFTMFWNGLPLSQISLMIEVNVRQRLGDTDLPAIPTPNEKHVLM